MEKENKRTNTSQRINTKGEQVTIQKNTKQQHKSKKKKKREQK
jgi:hypothetical protein